MPCQIGPTDCAARAIAYDLSANLDAAKAAASVTAGNLGVAAVGSLRIDVATDDVSAVLLTDATSWLIPFVIGALGRTRAATAVVRRGATGGQALAWHSSSKWSGAAPPRVGAHADAIEMPAIVARGGGTTWSGFPGERGCN